MRILMIDDDHDDQTLFCEAIKLISPNIACLLANNGQEALTILENTLSLPSVIFLDINMPVMDGRETLTRIRSTVRLRLIPIFIYSTSSNAAEIKKFLALGVNYIVKPNSFDKVVHAISKALKDAVGFVPARTEETKLRTQYI
jgi:CheY-like chemotaxis protein